MTSIGSGQLLRATGAFGDPTRLDWWRGSLTKGSKAQFRVYFGHSIQSFCHGTLLAVSVPLRSIVAIVRKSPVRRLKEISIAQMSRPSLIPPGSWPRRMSAAVAAGYCGEDSVEAFMRRVGSEYPQPRVNDGRRKLWLRDDLDQAILPPESTGIRDLAEDL